MSWILDASLKGHNLWHGVNKVKASIQKDANPLRMGVLGAAAISPSALFDPIETHPGIIITAIAARDISRARDQIAKCNLKAKPYGSYQELLDDPDIDCVYNPLPNSLHCEWSVKAMKAGKHVLCEKPLASNQDEARIVRETSEATGKLCLEAFHYRFHPANHKAKAMIESGEYGKVLSVSTQMTVGQGIISANDIRFKYSLAGGACMDLIYTFSGATYFSGLNLQTLSFTVDQADPIINAKDPKIDNEMKTKLSLSATDGKDPIQATTHAVLTQRPVFGFIPNVSTNIFATIELERARIDFPSFVAPHFKCSLTVHHKDAQNKLTGKKEVLPVYTDGPLWKTRGQRWWTTYRYQLEAFVDAVKAKEEGREYTGPWISLEESERLAALVDAVYEKAGLPRRGLKE